MFQRYLLQRIALMMDAASTDKTSVNFFHTTRRNNPEDSHLHTRRRENLKYHLVQIMMLSIFRFLQPPVTSTFSVPGVLLSILF
jgi:hypothetical protein